MMMCHNAHRESLQVGSRRVSFSDDGKIAAHLGAAGGRQLTLHAFLCLRQELLTGHAFEGRSQQFDYLAA